jgi:DNA-binding XRE family transcriptional regulator
MIRAARGLLNLDQAEFGALVGVTRRTIIRLETDEAIPKNPRRIDVIAAISDKLEKDCGIRFVYVDKDPRRRGGHEAWKVTVRDVVSRPRRLPVGDRWLPALAPLYPSRTRAMPPDQQRRCPSLR